MGGDQACSGVQTGSGKSGAGHCREVGFGHLEDGEEEAGAFGVEGVVGEAADDLGDGDLEIFGIEDGGQIEGSAGGRGSAGRAAGGVVEEAELLAAEGGRAARLAGGVEVMAGWIGHGTPFWHFVRSSTCCRT